jgi:micrococcal nuclease
VRRTRRLTLALAAALVALALAAVGCAVGEASQGAGASGGPIAATVVRDVDGDTILVRLPEGAERYVRLVGIDTPEDVRPDYPTECGARAAGRSMAALAPEGAAVSLRYDSVADHEDVYGRILAHAFIGRRQLELAQLRRGWAYVYRYDGQHFDGLSRFYAAEDGARAGGRGAWGRCDGDFHSAEPGIQN